MAQLQPPTPDVEPHPSFAAETAGSILLLFVSCLLAIGAVIGIEGAIALFSAAAE